jgi:hypothetical protein
MPAVDIAEKVKIISQAIDFTGNSPFREREIQRDLSFILFI